MHIPLQMFNLSTPSLHLPIFSVTYSSAKLSGPLAMAPTATTIGVKSGISVKNSLKRTLGAFHDRAVALH